MSSRGLDTPVVMDGPNCAFMCPVSNCALLMCLGDMVIWFEHLGRERQKVHADFVSTQKIVQVRKECVVKEQLATE